MRASLYFLAAVTTATAAATAVTHAQPWSHDSTVVHLNYSSYRGTSKNGVTQWLGVRYAAPPLGNLRFREPQPPEQQDGIVDADTYKPYCLGTDNGPPSNVSAEDCLFMNIFAPSNVTSGAKLPVFFFIQGGGFNTNSNPNLNGSGLVTASGNNIVVVNFNYRVGPYGFLASEEVMADGCINTGLKDQRFALHWIQSYISYFGGDPDHVTIGGDSAGAQSVDLQVTAYGGRDDGLFHASAAESQSFSGLRTVEESQFSYNNLVIRTQCTQANSTLECLRRLSAKELQKVNFNTPFPGAQIAPLFMYGPTLDYDFISDYTYRAYAEGKFVKVPAIGGDDTNEGTIFAPMLDANISDTDVFIQAQFPSITLSQLRTWNSYYPIVGTPSFPDSGRAWREASKGYGEMRYICPGIFISGTQANASLPTWNYRWNVIDPEDAEKGYGVTHTVEVNAIWGPENVNGGAPDSYLPGGVNYPIVRIVQGYWTSFIRSYDPNTYRAAGTPEWQAWTEGEGYWRRLMFRTNATAMETVPEAQQKRCEWLSSIGLSLKQ